MYPLCSQFIKSFFNIVFLASDRCKERDVYFIFYLQSTNISEFVKTLFQRFLLTLFTCEAVKVIIVVWKQYFFHIHTCYLFLFLFLLIFPIFHLLNHQEFSKGTSTKILENLGSTLFFLS